MASITSQGPSPLLSPYDFDSTGDTDESWQYLDYSGTASGSASGPASVGFLPSPASGGSLSGFAIVGHLNTPSPVALSPLPVDLDQSALGDLDPSSFFPASTSHPSQPNNVAVSDAFAAVTDAAFTHDVSFLTPQQFLFSPSDMTADLSQQDLNQMGPFMNSFHMGMPASMNQANQSQMNHNQGPIVFDNFNFQESINVSPWNPTEPRGLNDNMFIMEEHFSSASSSTSNMASGHSSPVIKSEANSKSPSGQLRRVKAGKVEKKKSEQSSNFVIVTPTSISAQAGGQNPFECFDAMRTTQRGRKGPLANETKQSALQVRRLGACFCCHSRRVKCDKERPCKNCTKLMVQVPQLVCWQFQDFLTVLFPDFLRAHFKKEEMTKFIRDNVEGFTVGGIEQPCEVELSSGLMFSSTLTVKAKFFTAKSCDILQHWHLNASQDRVDLQSNGTAPIGLELTSTPQREELRKLAKAYIQGIITEPAYPEQVTDALRNTKLPKTILKIVQTYAQQSDSSMVKRALSIYAMQYVLTRHLCITRQSLYALQPSGLVPQNQPWVTPRLLARQIKALLDELIMREMQLLFDLFSKSLKPKSRSEWAPCLAAFLVLCLFMEAVETTTDTFVVSENEVNIRNRNRRQYERGFALKMCKEVENMPFKQFAYQFHNIYRTHSKDANTKSFNPLFDDSFAEAGELDGPAIVMVESLKELFYGESWLELDFLASDDMILSGEEHPFPMDPAYLYTGRLLSKFLVSFTNENAIFGSQI